MLQIRVQCFLCLFSYSGKISKNGVSCLWSDLHYSSHCLISELYPHRSYLCILSETQTGRKSMWGSQNRVIQCNTVTSTKIPSITFVTLGTVRCIIGCIDTGYVCRYVDTGDLNIWNYTFKVITHFGHLIWIYSK